jgi:hypothetical protein
MTLLSASGDAGAQRGPRDVLVLADWCGLVAGVPFSGRSLIRFWRDPALVTSGGVEHPDHVRDGALSKLSAPNRADPSHCRSPAVRGPLISRAEGD